jgi:hypothetical protein
VFTGLLKGSRPKEHLEHPHNSHPSGLEHGASLKFTFPPLDAMSSVAVAEKTPDDSSKLKTFLSILRKYASLASLDYKSTLNKHQLERY